MQQTQLEQDIHLVEVSIEQATKVVEFGQALERLLQNKDFQTVIDDGYFTQEARRLTLLSADPSLSPEVHAATMRSINAIGELHMFILQKQRFVTQMAKDLDVYKEGLEELQTAADNGETE